MIRRSLPARVALFLAVTAWMLGSVAAFVHVLQVRHARCAEHGQIIELAQLSDAPHLSGPAALPAAPDHHDHGCALPGVGAVTASGQDLLVAGRAPLPAEDDPPPVHTRLAPPLLAAPKTSPPALS